MAQPNPANLNALLHQQLSELPVRLLETYAMLIQEQEATHDVAVADPEKQYPFEARAEAIRALSATGAVISELQRVLTPDADLPVARDEFSLTGVNAAWLRDFDAEFDLSFIAAPGVNDIIPLRLASVFGEATVAFADGARSAQAASYMQRAAYFFIDLNRAQATVETTLPDFGQSLTYCVDEAQKMPLKSEFLEQQRHEDLLIEACQLIHESIQVATDAIARSRVALGSEIAGAALGSYSGRIAPHQQRTHGNRMLEILGAFTMAPGQVMAEQVAVATDVVVSQALRPTLRGNFVQEL